MNSENNPESPQTENIPDSPKSARDLDIYPESLKVELVKKENKEPRLAKFEQELLQEIKNRFAKNSAGDPFELENMREENGELDLAPKEKQAHILHETNKMEINQAGSIFPRFIFNYGYGVSEIVLNIGNTVYIETRQGSTDFQSKAAAIYGDSPPRFRGYNEFAEQLPPNPHLQDLPEDQAQGGRELAAKNVVVHLDGWDFKPIWLKFTREKPEETREYILKLCKEEIIKLEKLINIYKERAAQIRTLEKSSAVVEDASAEQHYRQLAVDAENFSSLSERHLRGLLEFQKKIDAGDFSDLFKAR